MNLTFAANLTKMIDAGLGREAAPPETFVAVGRTTEYTDLGPVPIASFETSVEAALRALSVSMEPIQAGTGDPSPENVRPITGRSAVTVTRSGKNFANITDESVQKPSWYTGGWIGSSVNENGGITQTRGYSNSGAGGFTTSLKAGKTYVFSMECPWNYNTRLDILSWNGTASTRLVGNTLINSDPGSRLYKSFTVPADSIECAFRPTAIRTTAEGETYDINYIQIESGSVATAYEAPQIQSVTVQLGQTVYGGSLDVVSGVLTITRYFIDKTTWYKYAESGDYNAYRIGNLPPGIGTDDSSSKPMSNMVSVFGSFNSSAMTRNIIQPPRVGSGNAYMALHKDLNAKEVELSYLMASPITVQLTPEQIATLIGQNNVWSDGGDVSLTYGTVKYTEGY